VLLVLVIIGIVTAIVLPTFVRSIHGNRLRTAVRSVVMAGRYARSMAVLKQRELVLTFNLDDGVLKVEDIVITVPGGATARRQEDDMETPGEEVSGEEAPDYGVASRTELLSRKLDQVFIRSVEIEDAVITEGTASIIYSNNGRCTPYVVQVEDVEGNRSVIEVDALSSAKTEGSL
jgi:Tfp pilus assembly protein FimT